jgi:exopolyphosphatase/guanosine-5'-triphosphate,3'-diphosphate pyrophosphatase
MKLTGLATVTICPWALREGVLLRHVEDGAGPVPLRIAAARH